MDKKVVHSVFEQVAARYPSRIAVECDHESISYNGLNDYANQLYHLLDAAGCTKGAIVNVVIPSSIELVGAMIAVFKRGAVYLPVDLSFSEKRLQEVFTQTCDGIIMVAEQDQDALLDIVRRIGIEKIFLIVLGTSGSMKLYRCDETNLTAVAFTPSPEWKNDPALHTKGDDSNYIFYTSGSTGAGKAIVGMNASLSHFMHWEIKEFGIDGTCRVSQLIRTTFDASLRDIFVALLSGGTLCIPSPEVKDNPSQLLRWLEKKRISLVHCVPSLFRVLIRELQLSPDVRFDLSSLKYILLSGETLYEKDVLNWRNAAGEGTQLVNLYGATETTLIRTFYRIDEITGNPSRPIPVGMPISNTSIAIVKDGSLCKPGEIGEIYIRTPFATKGYYKNEQLTRTCFVQNPLLTDKEDIVYKTGDLGRYLPDKNVELLGRMDNQVKINGIRVELGEIEQAVLAMPAITGVIVKAHREEDDLMTLCAYYTGEETEAFQFQTVLGKILNQQLIPSYFIHLPAFPLNSNGKIDKKALLPPDKMLAGGSRAKAPVGRVEIMLAAVWKEVLGHDRIGRDMSFFSIGGNSLRAIQLISRVNKELGGKLKIADVFQHPTIAGMAHFLSPDPVTDYSSIQRADGRSSYPLSPSQRRLWVLGQFEEANIAYNMPAIYVFTGELDPAALSAAFHTVIERHEILRTTFREDGAGEIAQFIYSPEEMGFNIAYQDLRTEKNIEKTVERLARQEFIKLFDLARGPLLRAALFQVEDRRWVFTYVMHHIISDGWSMVTLIDELMQLYNAYVSGLPSPLAPLSIQYKDYSVWLQAQLGSESLTDHRAYWLQQFEGPLSTLQLPDVKVRPRIKTYNGASVTKYIRPNVSEGLRSLVQAQGCTLFMGLLAAVNTLFYRYTQQKDIIIGSPIAGRWHIDLEDQIGFYVNTLALRTRFEGEDTYRQLLENVKQVTLGAYEHQIYPFDSLVDELQLQRDISRNPLFDIQVIVQDTGAAVRREVSNPAPVEVSRYAGIGKPTSPFDMVLSFSEATHVLHITYNCDVYSEAMVVRLADHLETLLDDVIAYPEKPIDLLNFIGEEEKRQLITVFNDTKIPYSAEETLISLFDQRAAEYPEETAVRSGDAHLSYRELKERSDALARHLLKKYGTRRGDLVCIMLDRSEKMVVAILAVLRAGGAYVPVDPAYPGARKEFMIRDTGSRLLITQTTYLFDLDFYDKDIFAIDVELDLIETSDEMDVHAVHPDDLAYVIYTSGSTGQPKGVMIEHKAIINTIRSQQEIFQAAAGERHLQFASCSFDASVSEIFVCICSGAALYIIGEEEKKDPVALERYFEENKIDLATLPPAYLKLIQIDRIATLKKLVTAGEAAIRRLAMDFCRYGICYNAYGPTETSICTSVFRMDGENDLPLIQGVPIGRPIANTQVYILDKHLQLTPVGMAGEVYVGGAGLAKGYLNNPSLTGERFIASPFREGERIYRTGDLGRWLSGGILEFTGRIDNQVKIRGHRIELGEIEAALQVHEGIEAAVVLARVNSGGEKELAAWFTGNDAIVSTDLRSHLGAMLPAYMIPAHFIRLPVMPVTTNGKIDRKSLPDPEEENIKAGAEYVAPRNEMEERVINVFEEILKQRPIGLKDNFFHLGGDSIKSIQIVARLKQSGYVLSIRDMLACPVIEDLLEHISVSNRQIDQGLVEGPIPLSPIQEYFFGLPAQYHHHYNQSLLMDSREPLVETGIRAALEKIMLHHDVLRMVYRKEGGDWIQFNKGGEQSYILETLEWRDDAGYGADCDRLQASLDLGNGPLFKAALFRGQGRDRLLLLAHHLVVDAVSWRILMEDLAYLYQQFLAGDPMTLPLKTDSFRDWQDRQMNYAFSAALQQEEAYWSAMSSVQIAPLPCNEPDGSNLVKDIASSSFLLDETLTHLLLTQCYKTYQTEINDILVAGLTLALNRIFALDSTVISLEGHGREYIGEDIDISRTVGWFTTTYPVAFDIRPSDLIRQLLDVKERLRLAPNKGIGYGILRYLAKKEYTIDPEINFNYLGEFRTTITTEHDDGQMFRLSGDYKGQEIASGMLRNTKLDVAGMIVEGKLRVFIRYSCRQYQSQVIEQLAAAYRQYLEILIERLSASEPLPEVSFNQLFYLSEWTIRNPIVMLNYALAGFRPDAFRFAMDKLLERHEILRTVFISQDGKFRQQVFPIDKLRLEIGDPVPVASDATMYELAGKVQHASEFNISRSPLVRVMVFERTGGMYHIFIYLHHIITDGYSTGIFQEELTRLYNDALAERPFSLAPLSLQYTDFSRWQHAFLYSKEGARHRAYWLKKLKGFQPVVSFARQAKKSGNGGGEDFNIRVTDVITGEIYQEIDLFTRNNALTKSSFLMSALVILVYRLSGQRDITIITPVSGRNSKYFGDMDLSGLIGYFVNLLLSRHILDDDGSVLDHLRQVQNDFSDDLSFSAYPFTKLVYELPEITAGDGLLNTLVSFNYHNYDYFKDLDYEQQEDENQTPLLDHTSIQCSIGLHVTEFRNCLRTQLILNSENFSDDGIAAIRMSFLSIVREMLRMPDEAIRQLFSSKLYAYER